MWLVPNLFTSCRVKCCLITQVHHAQLVNDSLGSSYLTDKGKREQSLSCLMKQTAYAVTPCRCNLLDASNPPCKQVSSGVQ